jgi:hypothetical protein
MIIPTSADELTQWASERADECNASKQQRLAEAQYNRSYFFDGSTDPMEPAAYNKIHDHIDNLASLLFSPADLRYLIEYKGAAKYKRNLQERAHIASSILTDESHDRSLDLTFARALIWSLVYGSCFVKLGWSKHIEPYVVMPFQLGVMDESKNGLERQECFCQTNFILRDELIRIVIDNPDAEKIMSYTDSYLSSRTDSESQNVMHEIFMGGTNPIVVSGSPQTGGFVQITSSVPNAVLDPKVAAKMIKYHELWIWDDRREDYTTLIALPDNGPVIEGKYKHRNLFAVPGEQPYIQISPNEMEGYFWGISEITQIRKLQDRLNLRMNEKSRMIARAVEPSRTFIGFNGITEQKAALLNVPGGWISEDTPNAKVEVDQVKIPPELDGDIGMVEKQFNDAAGMTPMLSGQGDPGVRSGNHAEQLLKTGAARLRDRSLLVERQCAEMGALAFKMLQVKMADQFETPSGEIFMLSDIPDEATVSVNAHSSSPAFSQEAKDLAFLLVRFGAIDGDDLLELVQPPMVDTLLARSRQRAEAKAKYLAEHPEAANPKAGKK